MRILFAIISCVFSIAAILLEWFNIGLFLSLISYGLLLYHVLKTVGVNSVLFLFIILFGLYGYSVPVSIYFEADIGWHRVKKLSTWMQVDHTLLSFMLANALALLAILLLNLVFVKRRIMHIPTNNNQTKISYYRFALVAGFIASISEVINFIRAGGFSSVIQGKAYYQGAVNDLVLNIPNEGFLYISVGLFSMFFSTQKSATKYLTYVLPYLLSISFVLFVNFIIGERGTLLVTMAVFVLGYTIKKRITRIRPLYILLLFVAYFGFNVLTILRRPDVQFKVKGVSEFFKTHSRTLYSLMNPANTEFYASALNYRIFIENKPEDYQLKWGKTYAELPLAFIPTYIYKNKPKSILYEFRDDYFPEKREQGSTAGTGFSSLMEAYMNFGYPGTFFVYLISIFFLVYMESKKGKNKMYTDLFYLLLFNVFLIYSRSVSQYIFFNLILYLMQISVVVFMYKITPKKVFFMINPIHEKT